MNYLDDFLLEQKLNENLDIDPQYIISLNKFIFLSLISLGTYSLWWIYKPWKFFKQKEELDILPVLRALFSIFYLYTLLEKILINAREKGYQNSYSSSILYVFFFIFNFSGRLPDPFWIISIFMFMFLIPPFNALNYLKQNSMEVRTIKQDSFNARQIVLIIVGGICNALILVGLFFELPPQN
jgi:hypothetical protein